MALALPRSYQGRDKGGPAEALRVTPKKKAPLPGPFFIAGAGFEPATFRGMSPRHGLYRAMWG